MGVIGKRKRRVMSLPHGVGCHYQKIDSCIVEVPRVSGLNKEKVLLSGGQVG